MKSVVSQKGIIEYASPAIFKKSGYEPDELVGRSISHFFVNEDELNFAKKLLIEKASDLTDFNFEFLFDEKNTSPFYINVKGRPYINSNKSISFELIVKKISDKKQIECIFQHSKANCYNLFDDLPDYAYFHDLEGNILHLNKSTRQYFETKNWEFAGLTLYDLVSEVNHHEIDTFLKQIQDKKKNEGIMEIVLPNERTLYVECKSELVVKHSAAIGVRGLARDVTQRLLINKKLKKSQNYYTSIFENPGTCVFIVDEDLTISSVNSEAVELLCYSKKQIEGLKKWNSFLAPDERRQIIQPGSFAGHNSEQSHVHRETTFIDRLGNKHHMVISVRMIPGTKKSLVSAIDITALKQAEKKLKKAHDEMEIRVKEKTIQLQKTNIFLEEQIRESQKKYGQMLNDLGAVIIVNRDMTIAEINSQFEKKSGYSPEDIVGNIPWTDFVHPENLEELLGQWRDWLNNKKTDEFYTELECRAVVKNGEYENYIIRATKIPYSDQLVLSFRNVTSKTQTKAALVESERKLSTLMSNLPGMAYISNGDPLKNFTFVSDGSRELTGYSPNDLTDRNLNIYNSLIHTDDLEMVRKKIKQSIKIKKPFQIGYRIITASKSEKWVLENGVGIYSDEEKLIAVEGIIIDANDRMNKFKKLEKENVRLLSTFKGRYRFGRILGKSDAMQVVYEMIIKAAATDSNVIIYGQSGTGKELTAKAVHETSERHGKPFVTVNCGAIPENLFESEFFGYRKGAFTGAVQNKIGYFDKAHGGTLFMDEIGEIPLNMQVKLLRVIEGGGYSPVGSTSIKRSDVRIIFATNRNLQESIKNGLMREDFYYRIHIIPINLPAIDERREDVPLLIDHFLKKHSNDDVPVMSDTVINSLKAYNWNGNVREIQNVVHRYVTMGNLDFMKPFISMPDKYPGTQEEYSDEYRDLRSILSEVEKKTIYERLVKNKWNKSKTAAELQIDRKTLLNKIKQYNLKSQKI